LQGNRTIGSVGRKDSSGAERSGEDVTLRVGVGVFGTHDAGFNQPADVGMIASEAGNIFVANVIEAAVADVSEVELMADDGESGAGGAHSVKLGLVDGVALNTAMSRCEGFEQRALRIRAKRVIVAVAYGLYG